MPVLVDGDLVLTESRSILTYLVDKYAPDHSLYPKDISERAKINELLYIDSGIVTAKARGVFLPTLYSPEGPSDQAMQDYKEFLGNFDTRLEGKNYFAGAKRSVADYAIFAQITMANLAGFEKFEEHANFDAWFKRIASDVKSHQTINVKALNDFKDRLAQKKEAQVASAGK